MDTFFVSSFGTFVMGLFHGLFTAPAWQSFSLLACGWALATDRHTITTYLWLTGASAVKPFHNSMCSLVAPSTPNDGNSGAPSSVWRPICP